MNRITSIAEPRGLVEIEPGLFISEYFLNRGLVTPDAIFDICARNEYQISELLDEYKSDVLNLKCRRWRIDDSYVTVFEDGVFYDFDELEVLGKEEVSEDRFKFIHNSKLINKIFPGELIIEPQREIPVVQGEMIF